MRTTTQGTSELRFIIPFYETKKLLGWTSRPEASSAFTNIGNFQHPKGLDTMAKTGPKGPRIKLDDTQYAQLIAMMRIQATQKEICSVFGISADTLGRRINERGDGNFADLYGKHSGEGKVSLRRLQWKAAEDGNVNMLKWLGANELGQSDKIDQHVNGDLSITITSDDASL